MNQSKPRPRHLDQPTRRPTRRGATTPGQRKRRLSFLVLLLAISLAAAGVGLLTHGPTAAPGTLLDMAGNQVQPDPDTTATELEADHTPNAGQRFKVPAVDLNVPLGSTEVVNDIIAPPGFQSAYWISNLGVGLDMAESGTVFVATHSLRNGGVAPGNYLIDVANQRSSVRAGDKIVVGALTYTVDQTRIIPKPDLATANQLWESVPARLVVLTCLQNPQNQPSRDNLVITASLDQN